MRLSDFLLFPDERVKTGDGLTLTTFEDSGEHDAVAQEYLNMMVACTSVKEAQMIMTLLYQAWTDGELVVDIGTFYTVEK
jgi:hypothetical protein